MLKKLSLAALVAMGSMSIASATPLTEAIKNVDLNGMLRLRYYYDKQENSASQSRWRTNAIFIFKVPVAENMKFVFRNSTQTDVSNTNSLHTVSGASTVDSTMANNLLFLTYANSGLNVIAGKIPVATSITSVDPATPTHGVGAIATYNVGNGLTVAGAYVEAAKNASTSNSYTGNTLNNDIYALAAIYSNDAINGQAWYYHADRAIKNEFTVSANVDLFKLANVQNDYDVQFHVDYANSKLDDAALANATTKTFWNVNVKACVANTAVRLGYAKSSDDNGLISIGGSDAPITSNEAKTQQAYDIANSKNTKMWYADVSYNVTSALKLTAAFASIDADENANDPLNNSYTNDVNDYTLQADYAVNKKLSFQAYYDYKDVDANNQDNTEIRVQALYKF